MRLIIVHPNPVDFQKVFEFQPIASEILARQVASKELIAICLQTKKVPNTGFQAVIWIIFLYNIHLLSKQINEHAKKDSYLINTSLMDISPAAIELKREEPGRTGIICPCATTAVAS